MGMRRSQQSHTDVEIGCYESGLKSVSSHSWLISLYMVWKSHCGRGRTESAVITQRPFVRALCAQRQWQVFGHLPPSPQVCRGQCKIPPNGLYRETKLFSLCLLWLVGNVILQILQNSHVISSYNLCSNKEWQLPTPRQGFYVLIYVLMSHQPSESRDVNNKLSFKIKAANYFLFERISICLFNHKEVKIYSTVSFRC